jgi:hypothetical protein
VVDADYVGPARALYFDRALDGRGIHAASGEAQCFLALASGDSGTWTVTNLQDQVAYTIRFAGDEAQVECPDQTLDTLSRSAFDGYLLASPDPALCDEVARDDLCTIDGDCGNGELCCDNGARNTCVEAGDEGCELVAPQTQCSELGQCGEGEGCCALQSRGVCDVELCGEAVCCIAPTVTICSAECLLCQDNGDCDNGEICCEHTGQCSAPEVCIVPDGCQADADCGNSEVCCSGQSNFCTQDLACPGPCAVDGDCTENRICCGSQVTPVGPHCSDLNVCTDVPERSCTRDADCGQGEACCRSLDVPECRTDLACPDACRWDGDCGQGETCCNAEGRTPICVADGTCAKRRGEACVDPGECADGLVCCAYDGYGNICIEQGNCDGQIPADDCTANPAMCDAYPFSACCEVGGAAICAYRFACDDPSQVCVDDTDCGAAGFDCCTNFVGTGCAAAQVGCDGDNPF